MSSVRTAAKAVAEVQPVDCFKYLVDLIRNGELISAFRSDWIHVGVCFIVAIGYLLQKVTGHTHSPDSPEDTVFGGADDPGANLAIADLATVLEIGHLAASDSDAESILAANDASTINISAAKPAEISGIWLLVLQRLAKKVFDELIDYFDDL